MRRADLLDVEVVLFYGAGGSNPAKEALELVLAIGQPEVFQVQFEEFCSGGAKEGLGLGVGVLEGAGGIHHEDGRAVLHQGAVSGLGAGQVTFVVVHQVSKNQEPVAATATNPSPIRPRSQRRRSIFSSRGRGTGKCRGRSSSEVNRFRISLSPNVSGLSLRQWSRAIFRSSVDLGRSMA